MFIVYNTIHVHIYIYTDSLPLKLAPDWHTCCTLCTQAYRLYQNGSLLFGTMYNTVATKSHICTCKCIIKHRVLVNQA